MRAGNSTGNSSSQFVLARNLSYHCAAQEAGLVPKWESAESGFDYSLGETGPLGIVNADIHDRRPVLVWAKGLADAVCDVGIAGNGNIARAHSFRDALEAHVAQRGAGLAVVRNLLPL